MGQSERDRQDDEDKLKEFNIDTDRIIADYLKRNMNESKQQCELLMTQLFRDIEIRL